MGFYGANDYPGVQRGSVGVKVHRNRESFADPQRWKVNLWADNVEHREAIHTTTGRIDFTSVTT